MRTNDWHAILAALQDAYTYHKELNLPECAEAIRKLRRQIKEQM